MMGVCALSVIDNHFKLKVEWLRPISWSRFFRLLGTNKLANSLLIFKLIALLA
jgi:hypothetical protein